MSYRVVQWATGNVGRAAIEGILDHPDLELAGCWVHSADKEGADVGTLVGRAPVGIAATRDVDALAAQLQNEGATSFVKSWNDLMTCVESKSEAMRKAS